MLELIKTDERLTVKDFRDRVSEVEKEMLREPGAKYGDQDNCPLKHSFGDGIYIREIFMPKGMLIVSKIHRYTHPYFVMSGKVEVVTEEGRVMITAPYSGITPAGTKRILYIHEDCTWITVHRTKETDPEKVEEEIIAKDFSEFPLIEGEKI